MFKLDDEVWWKSQAAGSTTKKRGRIVAVVPSAEGEPLWNQKSGKDVARSTLDPTCSASLQLNLDVTHRVMFDGIGGRKGESYLVSVRQPDSEAKPRLYWPRTRQLKKVEA